MRKYLLIFLSLILFACGGGKKNNAAPAQPPSAALLTAPAQNTICLNGQVISDTQSSVTFIWNLSPNTSSYDLVIKNLITSAITTQSTTQTQLVVTLMRGTPYSWHVVSKSNQINSTAESDTWKFYNSGPGTVTYAPFPADIIAPAYAATISGPGTVNLTWKGSSPENVTLTYDVYLGTTTTPALLKSDVTDMFINDVTISAGTTYYWRVITKDAAGNSSDSGLYTFSVN